VLLVQDITRDLADVCPYVDDVWHINHKKFKRNIFERFRWYRKVSSAGFDVAINAVYSNSFYSFDCLTGWTGAPRRIGFECFDSNFKRDSRSPYFTELVPSSATLQFEIDKNCEMLHWLGSPLPMNKTPELWFEEQDAFFSREFQSKSSHKPYIVLFPGAGVPYRSWNKDNYIAVAIEATKSHRLEWVLCGGANEFDLCNHIATGLKKQHIPAHNLAGSTNLRELCWIFKGAVLYLGSETMAVHMAACMKTPAVCLIGGGHYGRFYPYPDNLLTVAVTHRMPCWGCNWECIHDKPLCISSITVEEVVQCVIKVLRTIEIEL
jgi:ADP-heptose:LPS heptosyltransferase